MGVAHDYGNPHMRSKCSMTSNIIQPFHLRWSRTPMRRNPQILQEAAATNDREETLWRAWLKPLGEEAEHLFSHREKTVGANENQQKSVNYGTVCPCPKRCQDEDKGPEQSWTKLSDVSCVDSQKHPFPTIMTPPRKAQNVDLFMLRSSTKRWDWKMRPKEAT